MKFSWKDIFALLTVPTTHLHTHTGFRGDCSLRQHTLHWVPYTHTRVQRCHLSSLAWSLHQQNTSLSLRWSSISPFTQKPSQPLSRAFTKKIGSKNISVCDWVEMWSVQEWSPSLTFIFLKFYSSLHSDWFSDVEGKKKEVISQSTSWTVSNNRPNVIHPSWFVAELFSQILVYL